jgi:hypothetical protein
MPKFQGLNTQAGIRTHYLAFQMPPGQPKSKCFKLLFCWVKILIFPVGICKLGKQSIHTYTCLSFPLSQYYIGAWIFMTHSWALTEQQEVLQRIITIKLIINRTGPTILGKRLVITLTTSSPTAVNSRLERTLGDQSSLWKKSPINFAHLTFCQK